MTASCGVTPLVPDTEQTLPEAFRESFLRGAVRMQIRRGQIVIRQDSDSAEVYYVESGSFRITQFAANNRESILREVGPGGIFGELAAIDGKARSASVVALESGTLATLSAAQFLDFLRDVPGAGLWMARQLAGRVRHLTERAFELATLPVSYRLQSALLRMAIEAGADGDLSVIPRLPTHAELAARIGTKREAVTRELRELAKAGVIAQTGRELTILSIGRLRARFPGQAR